MISKRGLFEMKPPAPLMGVSGSRWRRRGRSLWPFASALIFHLLIVAMIVSWRPAPVAQANQGIDVSLIPGLGQFALAAPPSPSLANAPIVLKPIQATVKSSVVAEVAPKLGSPLVVTPKLEPVAPKSLTTVFEQIMSGGPSLTATPVSIIAQPPMSSPPAQSAGEKSCELLETLKLNFQRSDGVKTALRLIPRNSLSVANAILLWNGRWIDESAVGGPTALKPIEQAVAQTVSQTPPVCQGELLHGVRFITLGDASDTMVLAFGSADWRWSDLLATVSPPT